MAMINCPECGTSVEENTNLCPHCATRVHFVIEQKRNDKRQELMQQNIAEINSLKAEQKRYQELILKEKNEKAPMNVENAHNSLIPIFIGAILAVLLIPVIKWFSFITIWVFPCIAGEIYAKIINNTNRSWAEERNNRIKEYEYRINTISEKLKKLGCDSF